MLNKKLWCALVSVALACILAVLVGCAQGQDSKISDSALSSFSAVEPEYSSEWPENEYTELIPRPEYGTRDYVCDYSDLGRYALVLTDMTEEQSAGYVNELKEQGFSELHSKGNEVSVGTMLQKENVVLSVAYSDNLLLSLIHI